MEYDLTSRISKFCDAHLLLLVLKALKEKEVFPTEEIDKAREDILPVTKLVQLERELRGLPPDTKELSDRLKRECERIETLRETILPLLQLVEDPSTFDDLKKCTTVTQLNDKFNISLKTLEDFYAWINDTYQFGMYQIALSALTSYNVLAQKLTDHPPSFARLVNIRWGVLACNILEGQWIPAAQTITQLDEIMDQDSPEWSRPEVMHQRAWLLHWALFVIFKSPTALQQENSSIGKIVDFLCSEKSLAVISLKCPHLLRYVSVAFLLFRKLFGMKKDLLDVLSQDKERYSDPFTEFVHYLFQEMDFENAQSTLVLALDVASKDYFLWDNVELLKANTRQYVFSTYCQIHQCVDVDTIAEKMVALSRKEAEEWIVDLIQSGKLNATIRTKEDGSLSVVFQKEEADAYSIVDDKTKNMPYRLHMLHANAESLIAPKKYAPEVLQFGAKLAKHVYN